MSDDELHALLKLARKAPGPTHRDRERVRRRVRLATLFGVGSLGGIGWAAKLLLPLVVAGAVAASINARHESHKVPRAPAESRPGAMAPEPVAAKPETSVPANPPVKPPPSPPSRVRPLAHRQGQVSAPILETPLPTPNPPDESVSLEAEAAGLGVVFDALKGKHEQLALELLDEQDAAFRHGQLQPEREAARILAYCQRHELSVGARRLEAFERANPSSQLLGRLHMACESKP